MLRTIILSVGNVPHGVDKKALMASLLGSLLIGFFIFVIIYTRNKRLKKSFEDPGKITLDDAGFIFTVSGIKGDKLLLERGFIWENHYKAAWFSATEIPTYFRQRGKNFLVVNSEGIAGFTECVEEKKIMKKVEGSLLKMA